MAHLEEITVGCQLNGIAARETVTVIAVQWYGNAALEVTFKNSRGQLGSQILYRGDEATVDVLGDSLPWSFGADADKMRLASEAYRIHLAHLFDPYLAVHTSAIQPLPHQITAVYQEMLPRLPLRYILADDPGAGKTIMTGLFIKELIARGDLKRCLIVTPGNLAEQWQDELFRKFHLRFEVLTNDRIESAVSGNIFTEMNFCIARLDKLSRSEALQEKLRITDWDLIVCDEAHKMSATVWGGEIKYTKRFNLGRLLSEITRNFLLLTATPHNGKNEDFQLFLSLVDPDRFEGAARSSNQSIDVSDVMRRLVKEELLKFDGTPLFPERRAYTVNYDLSPAEGQLYSEVTSYVQEEFNRAENLNNDRKATVGFALTILQRRLASSPEAIYQSLHRRRERLEHILAEEKLGKPDTGTQFTIADDFDEDDFSADELEQTEENVTDRASAASTIREMEAEISTLKRLEQMANAVRVSGVDRKWDELSKLLQDDSKMFAADGQREKLIIFTEHRDTLRYLTDKIRTLFAKTPEAQVRGYGPGRFSFNVKGGRCEACHGDGTLKIEMNFLPDVYVDCEVCHGKRYNRETLEVTYNGKTVADILNMPIEEAADFFKAYTGISRYLKTLVDVGLGYIRLGQPAPTLSGGESQRVKLATELQRRSDGKTVYILDEPTTGLHFEDVNKLLKVLQSLVDKGNTVIVIEHNLDVIKEADWLIDLGPEGGDGGGTIVTQGTPEQVAECEASWTGKFLKPML